jgi:hypothetical protein
MSYVIQNFNLIPKPVTFIPRFKCLIICNNSNIILLLFKLNFFFLLYGREILWVPNYLKYLHRYFYTKLHYIILNDLNLKKVGNYCNNFTKSTVYRGLLNFSNYFSSRLSLPEVQLAEIVQFNIYSMPIKIANIQINKKFFKSSFFFFMIIFPHFWYQHYPRVSFYLNFLHIVINLYLYYFYNGYFFRIYNI